ncbi:flagellar biosynthesis protein FlhA [Buchnera aphidicola]|uniref:flagellar biosynthesis protein FlhA n=1 Tax=Buchnera aphidicola TaxID=9 RepID=UPI0020922421|nr:flagellar biosynthesis protein FlhA [Buchnera aphidicola]USS94291.1 flagellar biosynthesis protein FlhA [Buchnera aphidicola (Sipha maydis)]WII23841.1 flagellar biosynthesis protein FlhA [Buchnera aphidicola (Sipha maydis)]
MKIFFSLFNILKKNKNLQLKKLLVPFFILIILSMMIIPLRPIILDILFTFNIFLSVLIFLITMFTKNILEFSIFPILLLFTTLFRLSLNIASTRVILLNGYQGENAAGYVIESFGHFLIGNNLIIGIVVFIILMIINYIVITKGAGRIAEVGARFILDGMPGKQISIDSDLNAGLIKKKEAQERRIKISQEADFYGSMDGASKFIRGDAISSILIMIINILGGLIIGIFQYNMNILEASQRYTLLTVGDGLVAQIPALVISTAAGVMITKVDNNKNISDEIINQLFSNINIIFLSGIIIGIFGLLPGMPNFIFLFFISFLFLISFCYQNKNEIFLKSDNSKRKKDNLNISWDDVPLEDYISIFLGKKIFDLMNGENKEDFLTKIFYVRKKYTNEFGFLPPKVNIQNNNNLLDCEYKIFIKGVESGSGEVFIDKFLAINSHLVKEKLSSQEVRDPVFNFQAFWINKNLINYAIQKKYTVIDSQTVIVTHLDHLISKNISEFFGRQETQELLNKVNLKFPHLIEGLIPEICTLTTLNKVLQNLLLEGIPIKDIRTILETLIENSTLQNNIDDLTNIIRISLGKYIVQKFYLNSQDIYAIGLSSNTEKILLNALKKSVNLRMDFLKKFFKNVQREITNQELMNAPKVIIVHPSLRYFIFRLLRPHFSNVHILSHLEIPNDKKIIFKNVIKF